MGTKNLMIKRYFLDTEFIEDGKTIDLVSIGMISDSGKEYYAINAECNFDRANQWVQDNVFPAIGVKLIGEFNQIKFSEDRALNEYYKDKKTIAEELKQFILQEYSEGEELQIWGDYSHYDYVVVCQLYGEMARLPQEFPYYCFDVQTAATVLTETKKFSQPISYKFPKNLETDGNHNALLGARSCKQRFEILEPWLNEL